ncbi:SigB/SigF/SigG family RNA polymerase sigma factor [Actinomadura sp. DC4]|uniref:SigB/SigF/SigG family RNA polymerase sigma factor n=1 Tax=Actinomadura sp. DC4 TaxID=3055069 RepID=UPI0025AF68D6|nr:SigB/SigF/SigG family RNA polymerase sigma factor [Actinomadura sp. DC4]MDN3358634.1 SigB/SigF/SigG family RNA polymerase sigma factor [Actinomadura sp. DC4]
MTVSHDEGRAEELLEELALLKPDDPRWEDIRSELVRIHTPLVRYVAGRYARHGEPQEDIEQAAMLGLVKAMNRYDPRVGHTFVAYAMPTMTGEVKRHFRDRTWSMRMPRPLQELRLSLRTARQDFVRDHGRAPTVPEVAELLGVSEEEAIEVIGAADAYRPVSLDAPATEEEEGESLGSLIGDEDAAIEMVVDRNALRPLLEKLPERERTILLHRFFGNRTQTEIAELMGLSQMHVSRLIGRSLARLRTQLLRDE